MAVAPIAVQNVPVVRARGLSLARLLSALPLPIILLAQAVISLRLHNSAFMDEALYIDGGRHYFEHLFLGAPPAPEWAHGMSGTQYLYPMMAGALDHYAPSHAWGLEAARDLSLLFMLLATVAVYALTKRLFRDRYAGLLAAALFASQPSVQFLGHFATFDAMSLGLVALAALLAQWAGTARRPFLAPLVSVVLLLSVAAKFVSLMFVPSVLAILALQTWAARGRRAALVRVGLALAVLLGAVLLALHILDPTVIQNLNTSGLNRQIFHHTPRLPMAWYAATLGGGLVALGAAGALLRSGVPVLLRVVLFGSSLLPPAYHLYTDEPTSMHKHIGFGLVFVAPLAGYAVARLIGHERHARIGRRWLAGVAVCVLAFSYGEQTAYGMFDTGWPDSAPVVHVLQTRLRPGSHVLTDEREVLRYYIDGIVPDAGITNLYYFGYVKAGRYLTGMDAYRAAIADGYFDVVAFSGRSDLVGTTRALDGMLLHSAHYTQIAVIPFPNIYHGGAWRVWAKRA